MPQKTATSKDRELKERQVAALESIANALHTLLDLAEDNIEEEEAKRAKDSYERNR